MDKSKMIAVIDHGAGNLRNVCKALEHVGAAIKLTDDVREIERADKIVLPGVGAFADCRNGLIERGLFDPLKQIALAGKPLLGICVGMQLLFDASEEMGDWPGLGLIGGRVVRFQSKVVSRQSKVVSRQSSDGHTGLNRQGATLKVPHIGWNQIQACREHPLLDGLKQNSYAYFVHSYYPEVADPEHIVATTEYGIAFASVVARDNVWGIQFHPEKSQEVGLTLLRNFIVYDLSRH